LLYVFFFQAEDGIRDRNVTGVQTCALPISFKIPDVRDWCGQFNVSHPLSTNFSFSYFYSTTITNNTFISYTFIFSTMTFPILLWTKNTFTEQSIFLRLKSTIINGFWFLYLSI